MIINFVNIYNEFFGKKQNSTLIAGRFLHITPATLVQHWQPMLSALIINGRRIPKATVNPHIVFIDSKALVYEQACNAINGPIDRSTPKRDTPVVSIVCYVFEQSGTRGCTTPSCPAGTVTLLPIHITSAFSYKHTATHMARARLCTLMRAYWSAIDTDQIPKILRQPERTCPRTETPVARNVALRNIRGLRAFDAPYEHRLSPECGCCVDVRVTIDICMYFARAIRY